MDELHPRVVELISDVKEIKAGQIELIKQGAIHNQILDKHERRSTNLEDRFKPVEDTYKFLVKLTAAIAILGAVAKIYSVLKGHG